MTAKHSSELLFLAACWGASFLFMREAAPEFGVIALIFVRVAVAALFLLPIVMLRKKQRPMFTHWLPITFVGLTNTAIPFCLFAFATLSLEAGYTSVINATAPMFGAIIAVLWLKDRLSNSAMVGLLIGFLGVFVLVSDKYDPQSQLPWLAISAGLSASLLYGIAACCTKRYLQGVEPLAIAGGSQMYSTLMLLPLALWFWPETSPSAQAWYYGILLGILCTGLAYIMYFRLIAMLGAAKAITVAYLVPVFGVIWGIIFLDEKVSLLLLAGGGLILLGVSLTTGILKLPVLPPSATKNQL